MAVLDTDGSDDRQDDQKQQDETSYRGLVVLLLMLPLIIFPFFTGCTELVIGVSLSAISNCIAIIMCWDLRKRCGSGF